MLLAWSLIKVREIVLSFLFLQMLSIAYITSVHGSPDTVVKVEPPSNTATAGETFTVIVTISDVENLFGVEVTLSWDASILRMVDANVRLGVESHSDGVLHEPIYRLKNEILQEEGKYQLVAMSTEYGTPSFNGSGNIVRMTFEVTTDGSSILNLETKLASKPPMGGVSSPIQHSTFGGLFIRERQEQLVWPYAIIIIATVVIIAMATTAAIYYRKTRKKPKEHAGPRGLEPRISGCLQ